MHPGIREAGRKTAIEKARRWAKTGKIRTRIAELLSVTEGVLELRSAMFQAGAAHVVLSLWKIEDEAAANFF